MFKLRNPKDCTVRPAKSPVVGEALQTPTDAFGLRQKATDATRVAYGRTHPRPLPREEHTETFDIKRFSKGKCLGEDIITICSVCKKIKDQVSGEWVEITPPTDMNLCLSHSYCMPCVKELHPEIYDNVLQRSTENIGGARL